MRRWFRGCGCNPFAGMDILVPAVLVALLRQPSHGYALLEDLRSLGVEIPGCHPSILYRVLRMMEMEGLLTSAWDTGGPGPARRVYRVTELGKSFLQEWSRRAKENLRVIERLITAIEEGGG